MTNWWIKKIKSDIITLNMKKSNLNTKEINTHKESFQIEGGFFAVIIYPPPYKSGK